MIVLPVREIDSFFRSYGLLPEAMIVSTVLVVLAVIYVLYGVSVPEDEDGPTDQTEQ